MIRKVTKEWDRVDVENDLKSKWTKWNEAVNGKIKAIANSNFYSVLLLAIVGFLLGRAMILSELAPFVLPYVAAIYLVKKERAGIAALSLVAGAITGFHDQAIFVAAAIIVYVLVQKPSVSLCLIGLKHSHIPYFLQVSSQG